MKVVYGVPWIEIESGWGSRPEGWKIFSDEQKCIESTKESSEDGPCEGGYIGPERPLRYFKIPLESLDKEMQKEIKKSGSAWSENYWAPEFRDNGTSIT